jgi:hypothetical protein
MYDNRIKKYAFPGVTLTSDDVRSFKGPKGKEGTLIDYGFEGVTTTFAGGTTTPGVKVGNASDDDAYGTILDALTMAADTAGSFSVLTQTVPGTTSYDALMVQRKIPKDTVVYLTLRAASGGGAAGVGGMFVEIAWDN